MKNSFAVVLGIALATAIWLPLSVLAGQPSPLKAQSFTTNAVGEFPALLPTTTDLSSTVIKQPGTVGTVTKSDVLQINDTIGKWTGGFYYTTNPVTAGILNAALPCQRTNCSANPTFNGIAGVTNGLFFQGTVIILANGADRTCTFPANVHVYPSGTYVSTNGSNAIFSYAGIGADFTNGVFLAFP